MDWEQAAQGSSGDIENLPEGYHRVKISAVMRANKEGVEYATDKGPFFRYYVKNGAGQSAGNSLWLTEKAAWKFASVLGIIGHDLKQMTADGVTIDDFHDQTTLENYLKGHLVWVHVTHDKKYANCEIVDAADVPPAILQAASGNASPAPAKAPVMAPPDDEVPF